MFVSLARHTMQLELLEELTILFQTHLLDKIDWHMHIRIPFFLMAMKVCQIYSSHAKPAFSCSK